MRAMIFVNLPVADLPRAVRFYEALGFANNPQFTDETAASMVLSDTIHVMLLTHAKWGTFTTRPICPRGTSEVMLALSLDSRAAGPPANAMWKTMHRPKVKLPAANAATQSEDAAVAMACGGGKEQLSPDQIAAMERGGGRLPAQVPSAKTE